MGRFYEVDADDDFFDRIANLPGCARVDRDVDHRHRLHPNVFAW